ncbi:MAG TPA: O-antigen ligase family protein [Coriobacteriia bacterium]|nr:O-antigen ligase family protein [Coriobacteriia bacterium]
MARVVAAALVLPGVAWMPRLASPFAAAKYATVSLCTLAVAVVLALDVQASFRSLVRIVRVRAVWPFLGVVGLLVISAFFGIDPDRSLFGALGEMRGVALWLSAGIIGLGVWVLADTDDATGSGLTLATRTVTVAAALVALVAIAQALGADRAAFAAAMVSARPRSTLGNASNLGVWLVAVLPFAVACARSDVNRLWRDVGAGSAALVFAALVLTLSRGALVGFAMASVVWLAFGWRTMGSSRGRVAAAMAALLVVLIAATLVVSPGSAKRLIAAATLSGSDVSYRTTLWGIAGQMVGERPALGWGPATFSEVLGPLRPPGFHRTGSTYRQTLDPHNATVSLAQEAGPLAALLLLLGLGATVVFCWRSDARGDPVGVAAVASLGGAFAALQSHFFTGEVAVIFAASLAIALAAATRAQHHAESVEVPPRAARLPGFAVFGLVGVAGVLALSGVLLGAASWQQARAQEARTWQQAASHLDAARSLSAFTHLYDQAAAQEALEWLSRRDDREAYEYGTRAIAEARSASREPILVLVEADLAMLYGVQARDASALSAASGAYGDYEKLDPSSPAPALGRAILAESKGRVDAAATLYDEALSKDKNLVIAWRGLERTLRASGDTAGADKAKARLDALTGDEEK